MGIAQARLQPADQRLISEQCVEIHRRLGDAHAMPLRRYGRMQIGQRLAVIEPGAFRHEGVDELEDAISAVGEAAQDLVRIDAGVIATLVEPGLGTRRVLSWR